MDSKLAEIKSQVVNAAESVGRNPADICLVAVSKTKSIEDIRRLYDSGQRDFGESRLQEALPKIEALPSDIIWHFIGSLQSNKVRRIAELFQLVHTLDAESQIKEFSKTTTVTKCFIEVNIGEESQKSGISPKDLDELLSKTIQCPQVDCHGLMAIGPNIDNAEEMRPYFRKVALLARAIGAKFISMGMSRDFGVAIQEGATHVRVGSALFGDRI